MRSLAIPTGIGETETGCHTTNGNDIALYVQMTTGLHEKRERVFRELLAQRRRWKGPSKFSVLMRLEKPGVGLFDEAVASYEREVLNRGKPESQRLRMNVDGSEAGDFVAWLAREFEDWAADETRRGCPRCGSSCGIAGCRTCEGPELCARCAKKDGHGRKTDA